MQKEIRRLDYQDVTIFEDVLLLFSDVFEWEEYTLPSAGYLLQLLQKADFFVFAALVNGEVVGGLTAYLFPQYYKLNPLVYVYDLAVKEDFQRQRIGSNLTNAVFTAASEAGAAEVFVQADEEDKHALSFYQSLNGRMDKVRHFTFALPRSRWV